jgi:hypothetical protein
METISFDSLPEAVQQANIRLSRIEELLHNHFPQTVIQTDNRYTLPEAAAYCRMPVPTFRAHLSKRNVSGSKPGKSWVFTEKDLEKFLEKFYCKTSDELQAEVNNGQHTSRRRK